MKSVICWACAKEFQAPHPNRKYCGVCQKCRQCGEILKPSSSRTRKRRYFCNKSCWGKWHYANDPNQALMFSRVRKTSIFAAHAANRGPRLNRRGEKHHNWKGGLYKSERLALMATFEYKYWRKQVFERDDYTCQICSKRGGTLDADHIVPYAVDKTKALDVSNGRTLCRPCHRETPTWGYNTRKLLEAVQ